MLLLVVLAVLLPLSSSYITIHRRNINALPSNITSLISGQNCDFYLALNQHLACGEKSHLITYSHKYCKRLVNASRSFHNAQYQADIRQCLQQNLTNKLYQSNGKSITCDLVKQIDLESHVGCLKGRLDQVRGNDTEKFIATFNDTTTNYEQLCKLIVAVRGSWNLVENEDASGFIKKKVQKIFPEGNISTCTIKEKEIQEVVTDGNQVENMLDKINEIKGNVNLVIEKTRATGYDLKIIRKIVKEIETGEPEITDRLRNILEIGNTVSANLTMIIETIKNLNKDNNTSGAEQMQIRATREGSKNNTSTLARISELMAQFDKVRGIFHNIRYSIISIHNTIENIGDGTKNYKEGLFAIVEQIEKGVDNIYSILDTSYTLKDTVYDLVQSLSGTYEESLDIVIDKAEKTIHGFVKK